LHVNEEFRRRADRSAHRSSGGPDQSARESGVRATENKYGAESLLALQQAVERLVKAARTQNSGELTAVMNRGRSYVEVRASARVG